MNLASLFEQTHTLPNIPKVVQELIATFNDDNVNIDAIAGKISMDPVLTAKVLRLANSAHYGVSRTISTTNDASVLLGFSTLRTLVLASGITGAMKAPQGFDRKGFWRNNFTVAAIAKWMAKYTKLNKETAFTCGMLHSIGEMLLRMLLPTEMKKVDAAVAAGGRLHEVEYSMLGFHYGDVGAELASRWKFPEEIVTAVKYHCNPAKADPMSPLANLLYLAIYVNDSHHAGLSEEEILNRFPTKVASAIGMNLEKALADLQETNGMESGMDALLED
ncbi:MAG: HDOD domain-containing protein [Oceanospirillaceae bacterium]|nr:HDOD domain-containing protein [Oceanospirillaceae bacterium]MCP5334591.1 HDOD domain-containing protein [Oceanospirillaceae bacterium]